MDGDVLCFLFSFEDKKSFTFQYFLQVLPAGRCSRPCFSYLDFCFHFELFYTFKKKCKCYLQHDVAGGVANLRVLTAPPLEIHLTQVCILNSFFLFCFFRQQGYKTIKLAHVWMGKTFVHKCFIPFCAKSIHNLKYFLKTNLFFTSSMVGLRENGVFLYTASKILAFTWLLSISIYLRFLNIYWYIDLCHDIISMYW